MDSLGKVIKGSPKYPNVLCNVSETGQIKENAVTLFLLANTQIKYLIRSICRRFISSTGLEAMSSKFICKTITPQSPELHLSSEG